MRRVGPLAIAHTGLLFVLKVRGPAAALTRLTACLGICIALFSSTSTLHGQTLSGIRGTVTDQSELAVSDARVSIANSDTGVRRNTETNALGSYYITDLIPGTYSVTVEKPGFKSSVQNNVLVQAATKSTVNVVLTVGDTHETIEVTASQISLETEQAQFGTTIQPRLIEDLPQFIGGTVRQIDTLTLSCLAPGVSVVKMTDGASAPGISSATRLRGGLTPGVSTDGRIDGGLDFQNEVVFNGVPIAFAEFQGRQYFINPPFDMVKEFAVLQGAFSAQYGLGQGVTQYQFQSGTNKIHGNAYGVYRDAFFDAAGAVNGVKPNDRGIIGQPNTDHEIDRGFTAGGPVRVPHLYDGRGRTFWFASIENFRQASAQPPTTVPTQQLVNGDFGGLVMPSTTTQIPIFVPISWQTDPSLIPSGCNPGAAPGQQFPGNIIPQNCFSRVSKSLLGFVPNPTSAGEIDNFQPSFIPLLTHTVWGFTLDHNINSNQAIHGAYWRNHEQIAGGFVDNPLNNTTSNDWFGSGLLVTYSHAITHGLVMTAGVSWTTEIFNYHQQKPIGSFAGVEPDPSGSAFLPGINFVGSTEPVSWGTSGWLYSINRKHGLGIANNWLYARGRHTLNFGLDVRRTFQDDQECQFCAGNLFFEAATTADPMNDPEGLFTGSGFASFLLGDAGEAHRSNTPMTKLRNFYIAPYFQDNLKITPRFTLNMGLRWDLAFPFSNDNKTNQLVFFNPFIQNSGAINPATGQPRLGALELLGKNCNGCAGWDHPDMQWRHFSPRLGFAYQLNNKTVWLTGVSFSFLNTGAFEYGTNQVALNFGNGLNGAFDVYSNGQIPGLGQWDTTPLPSPLKASFSPHTVNPNEIHRHVNQAYNELVTVGVQRELPWNMFTSVSYVHSHDLHLPAALIRRNQLDPNIPATLCPDGLFQETDCVLAESWMSADGQAVLKNLGFGQFGGLYTPYDNYINDWGDRPLIRALLPYPQFRAISNPFDTTGADKYDALQVSVQKRTGSGLTLLVAYTLSKTIANTDSAVSSSNVRGLNQFNPESEWSVARDDRTHVLNISEVYELPIGPGEKLINGGGAVMKNLLGGWAFSGYYTYASGTPVKIIVNGRPLFNSFNRANIMPGSFDVNWDNYYKGVPVFNIKKFQFPGAWRVGNASPFYSGFRNPFESTETLAVSKKFSLGERVKTELRVEFDNVLNRMRVCGGDHMVNDPHDVSGLDPNNTNFTFGIVSPGAVCQGNTPRRGQAVLRITF
ncbi:MAG: Oar protein [Acidobacteriaceae bacterium]|nr:Oar protein [Acidobacteriaceae bacterium]